MVEVEKEALASSTGAKLSHWFRFVDDIKKQEAAPFTEHIKAVDSSKLSLTFSQQSRDTTDASPASQYTLIHTDLKPDLPRMSTLW